MEKGSQEGVTAGKVGNAFIDLARGIRLDFGKPVDNNLLEGLKKLGKEDRIKLEEILTLEKNEIDVLAKALESTLTAEKKKELGDIAFDHCYDRSWCRANKVSYEHVDRHYNAVLLYTYLSEK